MERDGWMFVGPGLGTVALAAFLGVMDWPLGYPIAAVILVLTGYFSQAFLPVRLRRREAGRARG